jgi:hypothetical protein
VKTAQEFLDHFHSLEAIDPAQTNLELVELLYAFYSDSCWGRVERNYARNSGVTRTVVEFLKWVDVPTLYVVSQLGHAKLWRRQGLQCIHWRQAFLGLSPRPNFIVFDNPLSVVEERSVSTRARFKEVVFRLPHPCIVVSDDAFQPLTRDK